MAAGQGCSKCGARDDGEGMMVAAGHWPGRAGPCVRGKEKKRRDYAGSDRYRLS